MVKSSSLERGAIAGVAGLALLLFTCSSPAPQPMPSQPRTSSGYSAPTQSGQGSSQSQPARTEYEFMNFMTAYNNQSSLVGQKIELRGSAVHDGHEGLFYGGSFMASRAVRTNISMDNPGRLYQAYHGLMIGKNLDVNEMRTSLYGSFERVNGEVIFVVERGVINYQGNQYNF